MCWYCSILSDSLYLPQGLRNQGGPWGPQAGPCSLEGRVRRSTHRSSAARYTRRRKFLFLLLCNIPGVWASSSAFLCLSAEGHELGGWSKGACQGSCVFEVRITSRAFSPLGALICPLFVLVIGSVDEHPWQPGHSCHPHPPPPIPSSLFCVWTMPVVKLQLLSSGEGPASLHDDRNHSFFLCKRAGYSLCDTPGTQ